ncbi:MAP kinase kinase kinase [Mycena chlorophos]|uniref:MAP kinase kinase kinase n=1 Tax=Mycena chlorophos TaxID=658473 RepID=A0A8H6T361_MYCCL|nr:MAP kinase kinase kinase [Mycena chlorophos]
MSGRVPTDLSKSQTTQRPLHPHSLTPPLPSNLASSSTSSFAPSMLSFSDNSVYSRDTSVSSAPVPPRREKTLPLRTMNPSLDTLNQPAPSYEEVPRSLPPYPSSPPTLTGWAAVANEKRGNLPLYHPDTFPMTFNVRRNAAHTFGFRFQQQSLLSFASQTTHIVWAEFHVRYAFYISTKWSRRRRSNGFEYRRGTEDRHCAAACGTTILTFSGIAFGAKGIPCFCLSIRTKRKQGAPSVEGISPPSQGITIASPPTASVSNRAPSVSSVDTRSSSNTQASPEPFYFPGGRTRAHPKAPGIHFGKGKKKEGNASGGTKLPSRFLGLGKKGKTVPSVPSVVPLSAQSPQPAPPPPPQADEQRIEPRIATKVGAYPLDPYDTSLMEADRQTWELMRKLNRNGSPSFHNYGGRAPRSVLDLGCGSGTWLLDAATSWPTAQVIGFDRTETLRGMWPIAQGNGIDNIQFVRGNFVKDPLPFPDGSFDFVRMANLALCIPQSRWEFVLREAHRVLVVGGRLEFIDDHVFFPYAKPTAASETPFDAAMEFSRMGLTDANQRTTEPEISDTDSDLYNLHTEQPSTTRIPTSYLPHSHNSAPSIAGGSSFSSSIWDGWHEREEAARELEGLFEHMLTKKFEINPRPAEFLFEIFSRVFGTVKELAAMHLTLAPPETTPGARHQDGDPLAASAGLVLWPSTLIALPPEELQSAATKHPQVLLSCKAALVEYAKEVADESDREEQGEMAMEALYEYQHFLHERFTPPPKVASRSIEDVESLRGSLGGSSEAVNEIAEYQSELSGYAMPPRPRVRKRGSRSRKRTNQSREATHVRSFFVYEGVRGISGEASGFPKFKAAMASVRGAGGRGTRLIVVNRGSDSSDEEPQRSTRAYHYNPPPLPLPPIPAPKIATNLSRPRMAAQSHPSSLSSPSSSAADESTPPPSTPGLGSDDTQEQPQPLKPPLPRLPTARPFQSPTETYSPHPVADRVLILVTGDSEHFVNVDISGAPNPAFIRERVFTKLAIFDEYDQANLSIYRTEIGSFAIGEALSDDRLFELCRDLGDEKGTLKLLVCASAANVHEVHATGTLVPPLIPPLQPRRRPRSPNDSVSSTSENPPPESSAGYEADFEKDRTTARNLGVPSPSPLQSRSSSPLPPPLLDKYGNIVAPPPPPPPLSPNRASFVDDNITPPGTILQPRVTPAEVEERVIEEPRRPRPQHSGRTASHGRERRPRHKHSYNQSDTEESPAESWVFVEDHPPTPVDIRSSPARPPGRQQFSPSRYKVSAPYGGRLAIPAPPRNAPPPIPATSPDTRIPPPRPAGVPVPPKWMVTYKGEQKQPTAPPTSTYKLKTAKSMDALRGSAGFNHPASLQPGSSGRGARPPPLPVARPNTSSMRDPLLSAGTSPSLGTPKSFDGGRSYESRPIRPLPIQGSTHPTIHELSPASTSQYGSRISGSTLMSPANEPYPRPQSAFGDAAVSSPHQRYNRHFGPSLDPDYRHSPRAPSPTHPFPTSSSTSALPFRSSRPSEAIQSPGSPRSPRFVSRDRRPGSSSSSLGNEGPHETATTAVNGELGSSEWAAQVLASAESTLIPETSTVMPPPNGTMISTRSSESDSESDDNGTWKKAPSAERPKSILRGPPLKVQIENSSGGTLKPNGNHPTFATPILLPSTPSPADVMPKTSKRDKHMSKFTIRQEDTWAPRPPPEDVYERLEDYFPQHDLDKPVIEAASGGTSPTSTDLVPAPAPLTPAATEKSRLRGKKSIRIVAQERKRHLDRASRAEGMTAVQRKRSTKLWGSKVEEVDTSNLPESPSSDVSTTATFKWVRGELIGRGTYGRVYLGLNVTTGEMIAVKQVEIPRTASDKIDSRQVTVVQALKMESETLKVLDHPNIVQYLGFEETPSNLSIFLEYVPGGSIGSCLLKHGKFEEDVTKSFTSQILAGLEYLHSKGIIHRDLKSDNILVEMSGVCKISDFGISKRTDDHNDAHTAMQGTVFWMAPEVINTQKKGYNSKIDIWSIGCVVLEMWAGTRPWTGDEMVAVMFKLFQSKQPPPVPEGLVLTQQADDFRLKCFAINPEERPTAAELRRHSYLAVTPGWVFDGFEAK